MESKEIDSIITRQGELMDTLELLQSRWLDCVITTQTIGRMQDNDIKEISGIINKCKLEMCNLHDATRVPLQRAIREPLIKAGITVQGGLPVAGDSNTPSTSAETMAVEPEAQAKTETKDSHPKVSDQPTTSGVKEGEVSLRPGSDLSKVNTNFIEVSPIWQVYQSRWEKLNTRKGLNPAYCRVDDRGIYPRIWMLTGAPQQEVKVWYEFGALASVYTTAPAFTEIKGLPKWIQETVFDAWSNNESLKRGDVLELYFISAAPEPAGKGNHDAFHFIKLRRPDTQALNRVTAKEGEFSIIATFTEDQISTRRAWGLWVCLTEMDKVKYKFKIAQNASLGSFLLNTMTGNTTRFADQMFEEKRELLWRNKISGSKETRRKFCNMAHSGRWTDRICPECPNQKEPEFGKGFGPRPDKKKVRSNEYEEHRIPQTRMPRGPKGKGKAKEDM